MVGSTGAQGTTGLANFVQSSLPLTVLYKPELLWDIKKEALFVSVTGLGNDNRFVQISAGSQQGVTGNKGLDLGATGALNLSYNNNGRAIAPFTGVLGEFEMPFNFNIISWDAWAPNSETGSLQTVVSNRSFTNYPPTLGDTSMSGLTGPWLNNQLKNRALSTSTWLGPTGAAGDIVRIWASYVTGLSNISIALKYNKW